MEELELSAASTILKIVSDSRNIAFELIISTAISVDLWSSAAYKSMKRSHLSVPVKVSDRPDRYLIITNVSGSVYSYLCSIILHLFFTNLPFSFRGITV